jgi:hypothetical protein
VNIDNAFPSAYLKASDLGSNAPVVTIDRIEVEPVGRDKEMKPIVYFVGKEKGLVLNKTNGRKIAELVGSKDTDDWHGCQIRIYATETEFGGETVECIRVKAPGMIPKMPKSPPLVASHSVADEDDPPF